MGRCFGHTTLQRCDLQPILVVVPAAKWRAGGLLPFALEGVIQEGAGPSSPLETHFF